MKHNPIILTITGQYNIEKNYDINLHRSFRKIKKPTLKQERKDMYNYIEVKNCISCVSLPDFYTKPHL